jgi:adenine deaminase
MSDAASSELPSFTVAGNIVDVPNRRIFPGVVHVRDGRIERIVPDSNAYDTFLMPGFVDSHIHVESSMLPPAEFARMAVAHGTVAAVTDPHEIANVLGVDGVRYMIESGHGVPFHFSNGCPSCVPATEFETAGDRLDASTVARLLEDPNIGHLSEMMNWPGVIQCDAQVMAKIAAARRLNKPIDGHLPGMRGDAAQKYFAAGISTDHECVSYHEAKEKIALGVKILIREGSAARNLDVLCPLIDEFPDQCMLCSDDKHPNDLERGHINELVSRAVERGVDVMNALRAACLNPLVHYKLKSGLLREGDSADFIEVQDLRGFAVRRTWVKGRLVARDGRSLIAHSEPVVINRFAASTKRIADFGLRARGPYVHVIDALDGQLVTGRGSESATIQGDFAVADPARDLLKIAVVNRYADAPPALGFIRGFGLRAGAIASSVAHDSHNIVAVGTTDEAICSAVNEIIRHRGGLCVASGVESVELLPLPIAGLMSDRDGYEVARQYAALDRRAKELGSALRAPFMTLSFMALLVIPELKLSDRGMFDGLAWRLMDPFALEPN